MSSTVVYLVATLGTFVAAFLFMMEVFPDVEKIKVRAKMGMGPTIQKRTPAIFRLLRVGMVFVVPIVSGMEFRILPGLRKRVERKLKGAGYAGIIPVDDFIAAKFVFALLMFFLAFLYVQLIGLGPVLLAAIAGFFIPDLWARDQIAYRRKSIRKDLPFFLDLMTLSVEAGLDFSAAIGKVIANAKPSPLREEFEIMLHETQLGASRSEALHSLADRVQTAEIASLSATLIQAAQIGASIGSSLRAQSEIVRSSRFTQAEKQGAAASQKMLIPMVLFVMPAIILVIVAPIIIRYLTGTM